MPTVLQLPPDLAEYFGKAGQAGQVQAGHRKVSEHAKIARALQQSDGNGFGFLPIGRCRRVDRISVPVSGTAFRGTFQLAKLGVELKVFARGRFYR